MFSWVFMNFLFHFLFNFSYAASTFFFEEDFRFNCVFVFMHWSMGMKWPLELMWFGFLDFLGRRVLPQSNIFLLIINLELLFFLLILFCSFKFSTLMSFQLTMWICSLSSFHHIAVRHYWVFHREENAPVKICYLNNFHCFLFLSGRGEQSQCWRRATV